MEGQEFVDFIAFLPEEISENILCRLLVEPLSNEDFTNCTLVCKNWNETISSIPHLWKVACEKLGLNVNNDAEEDFKNLFLKKRKRFQQMKNGSEFFQVENIKLPTSNNYMYYYHNGFVASASEYSIYIWKLEPNFQVVSRVDLVNCGYATCIHFDDSHLVVGTSQSSVITFKMPTMEKLYTKMSHHSDLMWCVTFSTDINLLVTASCKSIVTFWCLSSGTVHFTQTLGNSISIWALRLISFPGLQNGCDYMLFCIGGWSSCRYIFDSQQITTANVDPFELYQLNTNYSTDSSSFTAPILYFTSSQLYDSQISTLYKCDPVSSKLEEIERFNCDTYLVGVGRKYACLWERNYAIGKQRIIIYDLATGSEFASFVIPCAPQKYIKNATCLDHASWLDGFDGFNDKGFIFILEDFGEAYILKWPE